MVVTRCRFRCGDCGAGTGRWTGRCPSCGAWNALAEEAAPTSAATSKPSPLCEVDLAESVPVPSGLEELDRVLGGGLVPGSVTLLGGEPGVGKSTLLLQVLRQRAAAGDAVLMVSAEESARQVRLRAERLGPLPPALLLSADTDVASVPAALVDSGACLVVVDSIQAVRDSATAGPAGTPAQVGRCAELLVTMAKRTEVPVIMIGHVTKEGSLAGPRLLEHMVDTVLTVEGDRHHALRVVRAVKHRFGPTGELGLFEMGDGGLHALRDPYRLLLGDRRLGQPGSTVLPAVEGERPLLVEVQGLVAEAAHGPYGPRRQAQGLDAGRLSQLLAVLDNRLDLGLARRDVFASVVGGIRVGEPAADVAVALALCSVAAGRPVPADVIAFGEVGLGGEVRQVPHAQRRLSEAARLGFRRAVVPAGCDELPGGVEVIRVASVSQLGAVLTA